MDYGWLSLLPPIVAIGMAFLTKRILLSLAIGILTGTLISNNGNVIQAFEKSMHLFWKNTEFANFQSWEHFNNSWHLFILLFCCSLIIIINLIYYAGGAKAYGIWALKKIKSRASAQIATMVMGMIIFFDDYFNCLTVGTVMQPVTDKFKVSRAKLAYIIDSTTAPICILAPVSSWVIYVIAQVKDVGVGKDIPGDPYNLFLQSILFNNYAWLTLLMVFVVCLLSKDFGPMRQHEETAKTTGDLFNNKEPFQGENIEIYSEGKIYDLLIPIVLLFSLIFGFMLFTGNARIWGGDNSMIVAFQNMHAGRAMFWGGYFALFLTIAYLKLRGIMSFQKIGQIILESLKTMIPVLLTLILAWTIGSVIKYEVQTGKYIAQFINSKFLVFCIPAIIFLVSAMTAFTTGSSWGTFAILIPIGIPLMAKIDPALLPMTLGAILAGAIYGDHASPISDTTILSSIGAGCHHIDHVTTQLPYATTVGVISLLIFLMQGIIYQVGYWGTVVTGLTMGGILLAIALYVNIYHKKE